MCPVKTIRQTTCFFCLVVILAIGMNTKAFADAAVIVNSASGVDTLSAKEIKAIFLGKRSSFPNGTKAVPVDQVNNSSTRAIFIKKVLKKNEHKLTAYWARLVFSGKGSPPKSLDDDEAVKVFVVNTPGGIGYIDAEKIDDSVTVVLSPIN